MTDLEGTWNPGTDESYRLCRGDTAEGALRAVAAKFPERPRWWWAVARIEADRATDVMIFRASPFRLLLVPGEGEAACEVRRLVKEGTAPGWALLPVAESRTPIAAMQSTPRGTRTFHLLSRARFAWAEEVAAVPDGCLLDLRTAGPKVVHAIRQGLALIGLPPAAPVIAADWGIPEASPSLLPDLARNLELRIQHLEGAVTLLHAEMSQLRESR